MNDFTLGYSERVYHTGEIREQSWEQYQETKNQTASPSIVTPMVIVHPAPVPSVPAADTNPVKRRAGRFNSTGTRKAGRHKLTAEQIERRDAKARDREQARLAERERKAKERADRLQREQNTRLAKQRKAQAVAERLEKQQVRINKILNQPKPAPTSNVHPVKQAQIAVGAPQLPGHTAVRIDAKTVIYVKDGRDINQAATDYKNKHGLI